MKIAVFLGSHLGRDNRYKEDIIRIGQWLGENDRTLVYGGSKSGLMGLLANTVIDAKGMTIGVETEYFVDQEVQYEGLSELIIVKDMSERIKQMLALGEAFIIFPGGTGTLEEAASVISRNALNEMRKPCLIYNLDHYYDGLQALLEKMKTAGFTDRRGLANIHFFDDLDELLRYLDKEEQHDQRDLL